jgi:basic amino acid/polyamine antiporter, APA family
VNTEPGPSNDLPRLLGPISAASILIGSVIGSGVFMKPQVVAMNLPSPGWILLTWAVSGGLALIGALAFAEMSAMFPRAGGQYVYIREAFGKLPAFLFGWTNITIITTASIAAIAFISTEYLIGSLEFLTRTSLGIVKDGMAYKLITVALILFLTGANVLGLAWGARIQNLLTAGKLLALGALFLGMFLPGRAHLSNLRPFWEIQGGSGDVLHDFKEAFLAIFWAYDGWYLLSFSGGEIKNPRRNIPLGFLLGMAVVIGIYLLVNVSYMAAIPLADMKDIHGLGGVGAEAARLFYGGTGLFLISLGVFGSTLGAVNGNILTGPRLFYAMARDGLLFRKLGEVHPRFLTPANAVLVQGALGSLLVFSGSFDDLADSVVFAAWLFYALTVLGLLILRKRSGAEPAFRMPGYPVLPLVFAAFAIAFVIYNVHDAAGKAVEAYQKEGRLNLTGLYPLLATGVIALGVPAYFFFRRHGRRTAVGERPPASTG